MLDYFAIFTKGGALLWAFQLTALKGDPLNALVRECLLEDRSAERSYTYNAGAGGGYTLKWSFNNVRRAPPLLPEHAPLCGNLPMLNSFRTATHVVHEHAPACCDPGAAARIQHVPRTGSA